VRALDRVNGWSRPRQPRIVDHERVPRHPAMRLMIAIVQDDDATAATGELTQAGYRVTRLGTTGGFLRKGNATLLVGIHAVQVPEALRCLERVCRTRSEFVGFAHVQVTPIPIPIPSQSLEVQVGGATVFVFDVQEFHRY
jgi:uncharacterized protein YaaQ